MEASVLRRTAARASGMRCSAPTALLAAYALLAAALAHAQEPSEASAEASSPADHLIDDALVLPAGTEIHLRLIDSVASHTHKRGERFHLEVAEDVLIAGRVVIPRGAPAQGEVVHAAKPGMAGKAGELILTTRFVASRAQEVKLRSFTAGVGQDRLNLATGLGVTLGIPGLFVVGKNMVVPAGADVYARVAQEVRFNSSDVAHVQTTSAMHVAAPHAAEESLPDSQGEVDDHEDTEH